MATRQDAQSRSVLGAGSYGRSPEPLETPDRRSSGGQGAPRTVGRHVQLTPVAGRHYDLLYEWAAREEIPWQWRGRPVSPEGLLESMWVDCLFHYIVETRNPPRPIGLVTVYGANFHHQNCYLQAGLIEPYQRRGWPFEAVALALSIVFRRYNMRRVYAQTTLEAFEQFASGEGIWFEVEGRLREYAYVNGRFVDSLILVASREQWQHRIDPLVERWTRPEKQETATKETLA